MTPSGLFCRLLKADIFLSIRVQDIAPEKTARVASAINWWSGKMFPLAIGACLVILLFDVYRILWRGRNSHRNELLNAVHAPAH